MNSGNGFVLPEGFQLGHAGNGRTGVTVLVCEAGAVGGADVRGGAPGTRETDLLSPYKSMNEVHAVVLSGGSAYGLESCCGVMHALRERNVGFKAGGDKLVPIVPGAVIFDLNHAGYDYPDMAMGRQAVDNAYRNEKPVFGCAGAGIGATVAKIYGARGAKKGGVGGATVRSGNILVSAVVVVNALGEIYDHRTGKKLAAAGAASGGPQMGHNTTIGCVMTNARLKKIEANKLAMLGHNGLARTIRPIHTDFDGDALFALSYGADKTDFTALGEMAVEAVSLAVINALEI
ncbi:MAG: P1 family peptidase [Clostridiales bacterium]|jgi:L-aminopeptidase/D-esterase-like protein|nr:P1 family peptidase [Clostridiales bacterium]